METTQQAVPDKGGKERRSVLVAKGGTTITGLALVGEKIGAIIQQILSLDKEADNFGVRSITFRSDGTPKDKLGISYPLAGAIAINLLDIWDMCVEDMKDGKLHLSLQGHVWQQLLLTILHEVHHVDSCRDPEMLELVETAADDLHQEAEAWAQDVIDDLAKEFDIEPVSLAEMGFFGTKLMEVATELAAGEITEENKWLDRGLKMLEEGIIYHDEANEILIKSFREYRRGVSDPEGKDDSWGKAVSVIDLVVDGQTIGGEEKPEPDVVELPANYDQSIEQDEAEEAIVEQQMAFAAGAVGEEGGELVADEDASTMAPEDIDNDAVAAAVVDQPLFGGDVNVAPAAPQGPLFGGGVPSPNTAPTAPAGAFPSQASGDTVELPQHIQQANAAMAAAAAGPAPQAAARPQQYPVNNVDPGKFKAFMKDVYMRLYTQCFKKCGWQLQSDQGFTNPAGILEAVKIDDLEKLHGVKDVIMEYMTVNAQGQTITEKCAGYVRGTVFTKSNQYGLPAYVLFLNFNGMQMKRSLVPQNPAKRGNDGQYKATALEARQGHAIAWVMADGQNAWKGKIRDNVYEELG